MNTAEKITVSIAKDFSRYPAGRYSEDGKYNGTDFRDNHLVTPLKEGKLLTVVFDGVAGLGSSFLEEAFGGLVRKYGLNKAFLDKHLSLVTSEEELEDFVRLTNRYIENADAINE